jgi:hypothetical protein
MKAAGITVGVGVGEAVGVSVGSLVEDAATVGPMAVGELSDRAAIVVGSDVLVLEAVGEGVSVAETGIRREASEWEAEVSGAGSAVGIGVVITSTTDCGRRNRICTGIKPTGSGKMNHAAPHTAIKPIAPIKIPSAALRRLIVSF